MQNFLMVENTSILMNAIEAMEHYGLQKRETTIVVTSFHETNLSQLEKSIRKEEWANVYFPSLVSPIGKRIPFKGRKLIGPSNKILRMFHKRFVLRQIKKIAFSARNINYVICGVYANDVSITFANCVSFKNYCLVDDGNMTIFTAGGRVNEEKTGFRHVLGVNSIATYDGFWGLVKVYVKRLLLGVKDGGIRNIIFFTSHHTINILSGDTLTKNSYTSQQRREKHVVEQGLVYFLGAPVIEREIMSSISYKEYLEAIDLRYKGYKVLYFPHRMESDVGLSLVREVFLGARIVKSDKPIEREIMSECRVPEVVSSFYSSALTNIASMNITDMKIESIFIPGGLILKEDKRKLVEKIYNDFRIRNNRYFEVVHVINAEGLD